MLLCDPPTNQPLSSLLLLTFPPSLPSAALPPALRPALPPDAVHVLAAAVLNAAAFALAALCLHRLGSRALGGGAEARRVVDLSVLFFCVNPASVFFSAPYTEALFAACTWAGLLLLPTHHWAAVAALTAAAAARSNGTLGIWFPLHKLLAAWRRAGRLPLAEAARAALSCAAILAPYAAMQGAAWQQRGGGELLAWPWVLAVVCLHAAWM